MSRKLQKLINYHTSGSTSMPTSGDVALGEIVVRHNNEKPELLIKKNDESFATFIDSGAVENAITLVKTTVKGQIDAFSATVVSDYATKVDAQGYATTAKSEAIATAKTYTDEEINKAKTALTQSINDVAAGVDTVSASVKTFSATVVSDYATKVDAQGYATTAKDEAIGAASAYTDGEITKIDSALTASIAGVENKVDTLIGSDSGKTTRSIAAEEVAKVVANADADFDTLKEIADWIQNDTTGAAKMANDIEALKKADGELSKDIEAVDGRVTTLNNSFTAYQETVASTYATKTGVTADIATAKSEAIATAKTYTDGEITKLDGKLSKNIETVDGRVTTLNNSFTAYQETVASTYATKTGVTSEITEAKSEVFTSANTYTDGEITKIDSALTASINALDGRIDTLEALTGTTNSAIQKIEVSGITGVDVVANGTTRTLDFTDMVIDCGDF